MRICQIAAREIGRRKARTAYTATGIALAVALLISTIAVGSAGQKDLILTIARYGHSLTIFPATTYETSLRGFGIGSGHYIPESALPQLIEVYETAIRTGWEKRGAYFEIGVGTIGSNADAFLQPAVFTPRLYEETQIGGRGVVVAGVHPDDEYKARFWWEVEHGQLFSARDEVTLGSIFAAATGAKAGDTVAINGRNYTVTGILRETDSPDDYMVFGHLKAVQEAFGKHGLISLVNVRAMCNYCPVGDAEMEINKVVVGVRATSQREIAMAQHRIFETITSVILGFVAMALIIACMAVFNMMMGTIHGRMREIGLLKMLGASTPQLMRLFLYEAASIGALAGLIGYGVGIAFARIMAPRLLDGAIYQEEWWWGPFAVVVGAAAAMLATLYPAFAASRIKPVEAFRSL